MAFTPYFGLPQLLMIEKHPVAVNKAKVEVE
jgi:hypothetical protein